MQTPPENFVWCLIGNIIEQDYNETGNKIKNRSRHFSRNTKVYCFPPLWGDGYENIKVIGKHRGTSRNVCIVIPSRHITNWRIRKVYTPHIIRIMHKHGGWTNSELSRKNIQTLLQSLM